MALEVEMMRRGRLVWSRKHEQVWYGALQLDTDAILALAEDIPPPEMVPIAGGHEAFSWQYQTDKERAAEALWLMGGPPAPERKHAEDPYEEAMRIGSQTFYHFDDR